MIIDGKKIASEIREGLKNEINILKDNYNKQPTMAVVVVGEDPASAVYVRINALLSF